MNRFDKNPLKTTLVIVLCALTVCFAVAEWLLPYPNAGHEGNGPLRTLRLRENRPNTDVVWSAAEALPGKKDVYSFQTDTNGFILPTGDKDAEVKLIFLGGSTTECVGMKAEERFPAMVGKLLSDRTARKVSSFNSGVSGNHSFHSNLILLGKVVPLKPDYVFLMHNQNDLGTMFHFGSYWNDSPTRSVIMQHEDSASPQTVVRSVKNLIRSILPKTYTMLAVAKERIRALVTGAKPMDEFDARRGIRPSGSFEEYAASFRNSLRTFVANSRIWGLEPILMTQANRIGGDWSYDELPQRRKKNWFTHAEHQEWYTKYNTRDENVRLIDLELAVPKNKAYMYDNIHLTPLGSRKVAETIVEYMEPLLQKQGPKESVQ